MIETFKQTRRRVHPGCVVCSPGNEHGLKLDFAHADDGTAEATFRLDRDFEGYPEMLHGGVLCAILDGAMTHCLFGRGCVAVTADLHVRFRHPVAADRAAGVRAWISRAGASLYVLKAEIRQDGQLKTTATGKFMKQPHLDGTPKA